MQAFLQVSDISSMWFKTETCKQTWHCVNFSLLVNNLQLYK